MTGSSRYALNLSAVLDGHRLKDRIAIASLSGFNLVEMWWPFSGDSPSRKETQALHQALDTHGSQLVCLNIDSGDHAAGERGILADPGRRDRCRRSIDAAVAFAATAGCGLVNLPYGNRLDGASTHDQHQAAFENLMHAAGTAQGEGICVLLEALNLQDNPRYLLPDAATAAQVVDRARREGATNVGLLLDVYHVARAGQDIEDVIARHRDHIRHVQFADLPDRRCPGTGELDFHKIHKALDANGYAGLIGLEFLPLPEPATVLAVARRFLAAIAAP